MRTRFRIREGVMVVFQVIPAGGRHCLKLVVRQGAVVVSPGRPQGIMKLIIGVVHLIDPEDSLEAALVEGTVVSDQREPLNLRGNLFPDIRENRSVVGVFRAQAVNLLAEPLIVLGLWMNEAVEGVHDLIIADDDDTNAADAARLLIGSLEVYGTERTQFAHCRTKIAIIPLSLFGNPRFWNMVLGHETAQPSPVL